MNRVDHLVRVTDCARKATATRDMPTGTKKEVHAQQWAQHTALFDLSIALSDMDEYDGLYRRKSEGLSAPRGPEE